MEYCGGGSVADLMHASDVPLDQDMISYICAETLAGLAYLHSIGKACALLPHPLLHLMLAAPCCLHANQFPRLIVHQSLALNIAGWHVSAGCECKNEFAGTGCVHLLMLSAHSAALVPYTCYCCICLRVLT